MEENVEKLHTFFDVDKLIAFISGYLKKPVISKHKSVSSLLIILTAFSSLTQSISKRFSPRNVRGLWSIG
ncbi:hypothetical protein [Bacillus safensis FO-36b] [Bacillus safensis subsp. safensis]